MALQTGYAAAAIRYDDASLTFVGFRRAEIESVDFAAGVQIVTSAASPIAVGTRTFETAFTAYMTPGLIEWPVASYVFESAVALFPQSQVTIAFVENTSFKSDAVAIAFASGAFASVVLPEARLFVRYTDLTEETYNIQYPALQITGARVLADKVQFTLAPETGTQFDSLYPRNTFTTDDFPRMAQEHVGRAIPEVVGFARGVPCTLIQEDDPCVRYTYIVARADPVAEYPVLSCQTPNRVIVSGDPTAGGAGVRVGDTLIMRYNTYTAGVNASAEFRARVTQINHSTPAVGQTEFVLEGIPFGVAVGSGVATLVVPPQVRAVYRAGLLVSPTEYRVDLLANAPTDNVAPSFATPSVWGFPSIVGGNSFAASVDGLTFTAPTLNSSNYVIARYWPSLGAVTEAQISVGGFAYMYEFDSEPLGGTTPIGFVLQSNTSFVNINYLREENGFCPLGTAQRVVAFNGDAGSENRFALLNFVNTPAPILTPGTFRITGMRGVTDLPGAPYIVLTFLAEQRDFNGALYDIRADVQGMASRAPAAELKRILQAAAIAVDAASFDAVAALQENAGLFVDFAYTERGTLRAYIEQLLEIGQCTLFATASGYRLIRRDLAALQPAYVFDERRGEAVEVLELRRGDGPFARTVEYYPDPFASGALARNVVAFAQRSTGGADTKQYPMVSDDATAAKIAAYLASISAPAEARVKLVGQLVNIGDCVGLISTVLNNVGTGTPYVGFVTEVTYTDFGCEFVTAFY